jgi:hypothetical protein
MAGPCLCEWEKEEWEKEEWEKEEWEKEERELTVGFGLDGVRGCDGAAECFRYIRWFV